MKEVKFRVRTDKHDIQHKMKKVTQFLEEGERVRIVVSFRGREQAHRDLGHKLLTELAGLTPDHTYVGQIREEPRSVTMDLVVKKH